MSRQSSCTSAPGLFDSKSGSAMSLTDEEREREIFCETCWPGVIKELRQGKIWPDPDSVLSLRSSLLPYFRQSATDKVILLERVLQSTTRRQTQTHHTLGNTFTQSTVRPCYENKIELDFFLKKSILLKQNAYLHCRGNYPSVGTMLCTFTK